MYTQSTIMKEPYAMSEKELNLIIAKNISKYLEIQSKTQTDLAEYIGVSQATVSNWCKGIKMPRMSKIDMICKFFSIEHSELMNSSPAPAPHSLQYQTKAEESLVLSYRELNDINKKKSVAYTKNLLSTQRMEDELLAAHERTDIEITPEGIQNDLDIMNDEDLWD